MTIQIAPIKKTPAWKAKLGTFSKALKGAIALNFSESGGINCSTLCEALIRGVCYAIHTEKMKPSIQTSGERKRELGFANLCKAYKAEIDKLQKLGTVIPWIRFSTFGSVPNRPLSLPEMLAFVELVRAFPAWVPVHFPVETQEKAERFRGIAKRWNLSLVVRESAQSDSRAMESLKQGLPVSRIWYEGETKRERLANAMAFARETPGAFVCPAIASTILKRPRRVKCGVGIDGCTACANGCKLMIIYPRH